MIDTKLCMGLRKGEAIGGPRCQEPATHETFLGRRCARCAGELKEALGKTNTMINALARRGAYTEEEIDRMVVELQ